MFSAISESITKKLEEVHAIKSEDREIYLYGVKQGFTILLNLITICAISIISKMLWQSILFMAAYIPLRSCAGGYHAKTPVRCYVFSIILILAVILAMKYVHFTVFICRIMIGGTSAVILCLAPVEDKNKPLDAEEQRVYRKRTYLIWIAELTVAVICCCLQKISPAVCLTMTFLVMAVMLVLGKVKNILL